MTEKDPNWELAAGVGNKPTPGGTGYRHSFGRYGPSKVVRPPVEAKVPDPIEPVTFRYKGQVVEHPVCLYCGSFTDHGFECTRKCIGYWLRRFSS